MKRCWNSKESVNIPLFSSSKYSRDSTFNLIIFLKAERYVLCDTQHTRTIVAKKINVDYYSMHSSN